MPAGLIGTIRCVRIGVPLLFFFTSVILFIQIKKGCVIMRIIDLSENAQKIMKAAYIKDCSDREDCNEFDDFAPFNLSHEELMSACQELEDNHYVIIEYSLDNEMYLYMLPQILSDISYLKEVSGIWINLCDLPR